MRVNLCERQFAKRCRILNDGSIHNLELPDDITKEQSAAIEQKIDMLNKEIEE